MKEDFTDEFERVRPQLRSYVLRITTSVVDTEDIVQETWLKARQQFVTSVLN